MLSHVISIPFIGLHSTHTVLQLKPPQSLLLPCRRNTSFPANSYALKRRKFHNPKDLFILYVLFPNKGLRSQESWKETVFCSIIVRSIKNFFTTMKSKIPILGLCWNLSMLRDLWSHQPRRLSLPRWNRLWSFFNTILHGSKAIYGEQNKCISLHPNSLDWIANFKYIKK